jgi:MoaA/NifB/PqqE/SkfB family radical SAM enzyme
MKKFIFRGGKRNLDLLARVLKWHVYRYLFNRSFPLLAVFYTSTRCNYRCIMCNIWRNPDTRAFPIDLFKKAVDDLSRMGCYYLSFSGGESLMVPDIMERIAYAKRKIPYVHMVTNGYLLNEKNAQKLGEIGIDDVAVSIDGIGKTHNEIRGVKGAFDKAIEAIKNLKKYSPQTKIVINTIIAPYNIDDLHKVTQLAEEMGVYQKFQPINLHPVFESQKTESKQWEITEEQIEEIKKFVVFAKKKKFVLNSRYFLDQIPNYFAKNLKKGIFIEDCKLPYFYCEFNEKGEMYPCLTAMDWKDGFSIKEGLSQMFRSRDYKQKQKQLEKCRICQRDMYICYLEPRITLPMIEYFKYTLLK